MIDNNLKRKIVAKLLSQYNIYSELLQNINDDKFRLVKTDIMSEKEQQDGQLKNKIRILERFSDEMTFPLPSVWIMYKFLAYQKTDREISTVKDFLDHCSPVGYVWSERFKFVNKYLPDNFWQHEKDNLGEYFTKKEILELENDYVFMNQWLENEFKVVNNRISKWK